MLGLSLITSALFLSSSACDSGPNPLAGLFIDLTASTNGDGSECFPFSSLIKGFEGTAVIPSSKLVFFSHPDEGYMDETVRIDSELWVEGASTVVNFGGKIEVGVQGKLTLRGLILKQPTNNVGALFLTVGGLLVLDRIQVMQGTRPIIEIITGTIAVRNSTFTGIGASGFLVRSQESVLSLTSVLITECADLIEINSDAAGSGIQINLESLSINRSGRILDWVKSASGNTTITLKDSFVSSAVKELFAGQLSAVVVEAKNVTFTNTRQIVLGSIISSSLSFDNCSFLAISNRLFDLSALLGRVQLSNSTIRGVSPGPLVLLPFNKYSATSASVTFSRCHISNVTNLSSNVVSSLFLGFSVTFYLQDSEVWGCTVFEGGLFRVTGGSAWATNVYYHDSSANMICFYEAISSSVSLANVTLFHISNDEAMFAECIVGSMCLWTNVNISMSIDPKSTFSRSFVMLWTAFFASSTIRNSYFHNIGRSSPSIGTTDGGSVTMYDSTFVELNHNAAFIASSDGFMIFDNITLVNPIVSMIFACIVTTKCVNVSRIQIVGNAIVPVFLNSMGGMATVSDIVLTNITDSIFILTDINLETRNVTAKNIRGFVCKGCINSRISMHSFTLEDSTIQVVFQTIYSFLTFVEFHVRNVSCEQFLILDSSKINISDGLLEDLNVMSFEGLASATSSSIYINFTHFHGINSKLSIHIGLFYLFNSLITISSSSFTHFNSTLIYAVESSVTLIGSRFDDGGLLMSEKNKAVQSLGSVLWSVYSSKVTVSGCWFENLSADEGGVLYLTGSGVETCEISNSTAVANWAMKRGGFVFANQVNVTLRECDVFHNSAMHGGALWIAGSNGELLTVVINSRFVNNAAVFEGGAIFHIKSECVCRDCSWANNSAEYGPDFASELSFISVIHNETYEIIPNYTIQTVSGQTFYTEIAFGWFDELSQLIKTDNSSKLTLSTLELHSSIIVPILLETKLGVVTAPSITLIGVPGTQVTVIGMLSNNFTQSLFSVFLRDCLIGESYDQFQCKLCTHNTYSLDPQQPCTLCPETADCPGGYELSLHRGYWRPSNLSVAIYKCLVPELCLGGFDSECADGHIGVMCSQRASGYFKVNQLQSITCKSSFTYGFKGISTFAIAIASIVYELSGSAERVMVHLVIFDYFQSMRILVNYNIYWPESLAYFYAVVGDIGSIGLTFFTDPCIGNIPGLTMIYSQMIISVMYIPALLFVLCGVSFFVKLIVKSISKEAICNLCLYVVYLLAPMELLRIVQLFPCYHIGDNDFLIYDSSVECWSSTHLIFTLTVALPLFAIALSLPILLLIGAISSSDRIIKRMPKWKYICLGTFLFRKYVLTVVLLFSNTLELCTQVGIVIAINIATEISMYKTPDCQDMFFFALYQSTLISSTFQSFFCVLYFASDSTITDKTAAFICGNYVSITLPVLYAGGYAYYYRRVRSKVSPVISSEARPEASDKIGSIHPDESFSEAFMQVPSSTPAQQEDSLVNQSS